VFACVSENGKLYIYDLAISQSTPVEEFFATSTESVPARTLAFNPMRKEWIAVGDKNGQVSIWKLKSCYTQQSLKDLPTLEELNSIVGFTK
jgi:WD40 repeat protein